MNNSIRAVPTGFPVLLAEIKDRVQQAQTRAILSANVELVRLYWDIGRLIDERQRREGWGAAVIPRLSRELRNDLPEEKGCSERNIKRMLAFYREYTDLQPAAPMVPPPVARLAPVEKVPPPVAQLPDTPKTPPFAATSRDHGSIPSSVPRVDSILWMVPWAHHVVLMEKVKDRAERFWYMRQTLANGWSRNVLLTMIQSQAHRRQGKAVTNFDRLLPPPQSDLARQALKDPYIFDFLTLDESFHERELETHLLRALERFLLELGQGFAFVGRQVRLDVGDEDFYVDLLFYHLKLRCFIVIDLKIGEFKPEYAGKMNFYLSIVDDRLRQASDSPSIGLILCQERNRVVAEYALRGMNKPIGVAEYELTRTLPSTLRSALPTVEEIEAELSKPAARRKPEPAKPATARQATSRRPTKKLSKKKQRP
ncbi:MAG: PDDEXK nuclease domain-containing protein [Thermodesulfobacteriota bacterium]